MKNKMVQMNMVLFLAICTGMTLIFGCARKAEYKQDNQEKFMFYLHGGVVQEQGINAVSPQYGKYEYTAIVDTLQRQGFKVISEIRRKGTEEMAYAEKIKNQIDSLMSIGVSPGNIVVVGASAGAYIAMESAMILENPDIKFVLLGLCGEYAVNYFSSYKDRIAGDFLSIYESSDSKGSCASIFSEPSSKVRFHEIKLDMGINHSFLFGPHDEWVQPLVEWVRE